MWEYQMIVGQRDPQLSFEPIDLLGEGDRLAGQPTIVVAQHQVLALHEAGIDDGTGWRYCQALRNDGRVTKHDLGGDGDDLPAFALLDDLGVQQLWRSNPPTVWESASVTISGRLIPLTIDMQQRRTILGQLVAGEQRDVLIGDVGHPL